MSDVRFLLDGRPIQVPALPATTTVLEYLRDGLHRTGTKEGCAEGDCGACTVVLGELAADGSAVRYRAVNSCIRLLPTIDGRELVTVESLRGPDGSLHPVQQAMVDEHASQCGFCTPGFVMSLFALYLDAPAVDRAQVLEALSGNLCRCTGYRPIIAAGCRMQAYPAPRHWGSDASRDPGRIAALGLLAAQRRERPLQLPDFQAPRTLDEVADALQAKPDALILAGGTDVGLWVTKELRELPAIVYIGEVAALRELRSDAAGLSIGAAVALTDAWAALVAVHPGLAEVAQRFGSPPVRNSGTLCGNLANGSPIGDSLPVLLALDAQLTLRRGGATRRVPLDRFYLGYQRKDLAPGEFIESVFVPAPQPGQIVACYKVSKRFDQDISAVCGAFALRLEAGRIAAARLAFGGMAAVAARAPAAERALRHADWSEASFAAAAAALTEDFQPLTDLRAGRDYRLQAAGNLLRRLCLQRGAAPGPLRTAAAAAAAAAAGGTAP